MSHDTPASTSPDASRAGNTEYRAEDRVAAQTGRVSQPAGASASDKPAPHGTPHEVAGSPVRNLDDLNGDGSPGTSNEATKHLPP